MGHQETHKGHERTSHPSPREFYHECPHNTRVAGEPVDSIVKGYVANLAFVKSQADAGVSQADVPRRGGVANARQGASRQRESHHRTTAWEQLLGDSCHHDNLLCLAYAINDTGAYPTTAHRLEVRNEEFNLFPTHWSARPSWSACGYRNQGHPARRDFRADRVGLRPAVKKGCGKVGATSEETQITQLNRPEQEERLCCSASTYT